MAVYINEVVGFTTAAGGPPARVVVYGVAIPPTSLMVALNWGGGRNEVLATFLDLAWEAEFREGPNYPSGDITCLQQVRVEATVEGVEFDSKQLFVRCYPEPQCPRPKRIEPTDVIIRECHQGLREVAITVRIDPREEPTLGHIEVRNLESEERFDFPDYSWPSHVTEATRTRGLPQGRYLAQLVLDFPGPCPGPTAAFLVDACDCPTIVFGTPSVDTLVDGRKSVTGSADVQVTGGLVSADLDLVRDVLPYASQVSRLDHGVGEEGMTIPLSGTAVGVEPGSYRLVVTINEPAMCSSPVSPPFTVEGGLVLHPVRPIEEFESCPTISLDEPTVGPSVDGRSRVGARASVRVRSPRVSATLELRGGATPIMLQRAQNQSADFALEGAVDVAPGDYVVAVTVDKPEGCPGAEKPLKVDGGGQKPPKLPPPEKPSLLCIVLERLWMIFLLALLIVLVFVVAAAAVGGVGFLSTLKELGGTIGYWISLGVFVFFAKLAETVWLGILQIVVILFVL